MRRTTDQSKQRLCGVFITDQVEITCVCRERASQSGLSFVSLTEDE